MKSPSPGETVRPDRGVDRHSLKTTATAVGALVVLGWVWHEAMLVASTREPFLAIRLLPGWLLAVGLGAAAGWICGLHRLVYYGMLVLAGLASLALGPDRTSIGPGIAALSSAALILLLGGGLARWLIRRHQRLGSIAVPVAVGAVLSIATHAYRFGFDQRSWPVLAGSLILVLGQFGGAKLRVPAGALAVLVSATLAGLTSHDRGGLGRADQTPVAPRPGTDGPNLVLIVLDTVSARHLAPYGYHRVTTPELDAFVRRHATIFTEARSTSPWTLPSHASLFTGLLPAQHNTTHPRRPLRPRAGAPAWPADPLPRTVPTLAELLARAGYRTEAIVANSAYLDQQFGLDRGFEHYDVRKPAVLPAWSTLAQMLGWRPDLGRKPYRDARTITDLAIRRLDDQTPDRPFFLFVNYMDAHGPYMPPRPFDRVFGSGRPVDPLNPPRAAWSDLYDGEIRYLDLQLGRFLGALERHGRFDDSVVIITSDHGEAFSQRGFWGHGAFVYEELIHVPLYLKPARGRRLERETTRITLAEVFHLMLRELGLGVAGADSDQPDEVVAEVYRYAPMTKRYPELDLGRDVITWFEGSRKVIVSSRGDLEVYDLAVDPGEVLNLAGEVENRQELLDRAARWWTANPPSRIVSEQELDAETIEQLRALGYVQ